MRAPGWHTNRAIAKTVNGVGNTERNVATEPWTPEVFLTHNGVTIYHAFKDEFSDVCLDFWYSTSANALPNSDCEFDVRELPGFRGNIFQHDSEEHVRAIEAAIDAGFLHSESPYQRWCYD